MASFRLVFPNGTDAAIDAARDVAVRDGVGVTVTPAEDSYWLRNCGTVALKILIEEEETVELQANEERELKTECRFYVKGQKRDTLHSIMAAGRVKRRRLEERTQRRTCFGFQLYRLRGSQGGEPGMEADLASWFRGDVEYACLSDYMVDLPWLLSAVPSLASIPEILLIHGEVHDDSHLRRAVELHGLKQMALHKPPLPIPYGTHHSKACLLKCPTGMRVVVHTANLIHADCGEKTQGAWVQDFPRKTASSDPESAFEQDLLWYFGALRLPAARKRRLFELIQAHDFSASRVKLIASVPGYHKGEEMKRYGHLLVKRCLEEEVFSNVFHSAPVICQFSSLGSLDEKWLYHEFLASLSAGRTDEAGANLQPPSHDAQGLQLIWPTSEQVRRSREGWAAGVSIPGPAKNVQKPFLTKHWHKFHGAHLNRERAMPHIKSYVRYADSHLAWVMLASHNLSKAAWGTMQKKGTQLMIRSYELGVLFLPSLERRFWQSPTRHFHCTDLISSSSIPKEISFVPYPSSLSQEEDPEECMFVQFSLPFQLPPQPYSESDMPWMVDASQTGFDCLGQPWGKAASLYGHLEAADVTV